MEKLKNKHDHALTQWLKVIIFGILMLAPFFSVLSRCLYVTCNKNAKDSYSGETTYEINYKYQSNEVNSYSDLVEGNIYHFSLDYHTVYDFQDDNKWFELHMLSYYVDGSQDDIYLDEILFPFESTNYYGLYIIDRDITIYNNDGLNYYYSVINTIQNWSVEGIIIFDNNWTSATAGYYTDCFSYTDYNEIESVNIDTSGTLDNAFEYSVNQLTQSQTFNWVTNTAIYQPINAMTTGLGFDANNNIVALLLTYWAILTAVYVLFDIIISCFVKLTHLVTGNS